MAAGTIADTEATEKREESKKEEETRQGINGNSSSEEPSSCKTQEYFWRDVEEWAQAKKEAEELTLDSLIALGNEEQEELDDPEDCSSKMYCVAAVSVEPPWACVCIL